MSRFPYILKKIKKIIAQHVGKDLNLFQYIVK